MRANAEEELLRVVPDWDEAMVQNDAHAIGRYMAVDWTIVAPDGGSMDKPAFLGLIESGVLKVARFARWSASPMYSFGKGLSGNAS